MKKHLHIGTLFILLAFLFLLLYGFTPEFTDKDGVVRESYGFVVVAYLSLFLGIVVYFKKFLKDK